MFLEKANPALRRVEKRNYRMDETQCLRMIRASLAPSTGCTEPAAIALNAATARKAAQGTVTQVTARLDAYLFKNAMGVGIPGADERGVDLCVALGITAGDADAGMNALHTVTAEQLAATLNGAAEHNISQEAALAAGYDGADRYVTFLLDQGEVYVSAGEPQNIVQVMVGLGTVYYKDAPLYALLRGR